MKLHQSFILPPSPEPRPINWEGDKPGCWVCAHLSCRTLKGKEIIEYYLRQLEEEGITFVPRWTPPPTGPSSETCSSSKNQATSAAVLVPDAAAVKEGLSGEVLSSPGTVAEPVVGTPDGEPGPAEGDSWASPLSTALPNLVSSGSPSCTEEKVCPPLAFGLAPDPRT